MTLKDSTRLYLTIGTKRKIGEWGLFAIDGLLTISSSVNSFFFVWLLEIWIKSEKILIKTYTNWCGSEIPQFKCKCMHMKIFDQSSTW